jgi:hypothetical protein
MPAMYDAVKYSQILPMENNVGGLAQLFAATWRDESFYDVLLDFNPSAPVVTRFGPEILGPDIVGRILRATGRDYSAWVTANLNATAGGARTGSSAFVRRGG